MLQKQAVKPELLELLEELMLVEEFTNFNLVGGTALAFDEKIFVEYNFELIEPIKIIDGIRLVSKKDIAAMKLNAIAGSGSKKDFVDVYQLLKEFTLTEMLSYYIQKYPNGSEFMVLKSMLYFDDADNEPDSIMLRTITWNQIKEKIAVEVANI